MLKFDKIITSNKILKSKKKHLNDFKKIIY